MFSPCTLFDPAWTVQADTVGATRDVYTGPEVLVILWKRMGASQIVAPRPTVTKHLSRQKSREEERRDGAKGRVNGG